MPGRGLRGQARQPVGQLPQPAAGEVVDGEAQLVAVGALLADAAAGHLCADARVVDEAVELRVVPTDGRGQLADLVERGEVGAVPAETIAPGRPPDLVEGGA